MSALVEAPLRTGLCIAGTDPLGGAGIGADAFVFAECGVEPLSIPTALVVQNSCGVRSFSALDTSLLDALLACTLEDRRPDVIKVGMTGSVSNARLLADRLDALGVPVVLDPVLASGDAAQAPLFSDASVDALRALAACATLVTPNAHELGLLCGVPPATDPEGLEAQARRLHATLGCAVLAKGGHVDPPGSDFLIRAEGALAFPVQEGWPHDVHGTGCHLSSAIAAAIARGAPLPAAVEAGRAYLQRLWSAGRVRRIGQGRHQFLHALSLP